MNGQPWGSLVLACEVAPPADQPWWVGPIAGLLLLMLSGFLAWLILR